MLRTLAVAAAMTLLLLLHAAPAMASAASSVPPVRALKASVASAGVGIRLVDVPIDGNDGPRARSHIVDRLTPGSTNQRRVQVDVLVTAEVPSAAPKGGQYERVRAKVRSTTASYTGDGANDPWTAKLKARSGLVARHMGEKVLFSAALQTPKVGGFGLPLMVAAGTLVLITAAGVFAAKRRQLHWTGLSERGTA
jgi:hypothetical protein